jgi:hemophore-related protein
MRASVNFMRSKAKVLIASGGLLLSLTAGAGIASAQPDMGSIINTTCSYPQVVAALNAQDPAAANELNSSPFVSGWIQSFLNSGPAERTTMAAQAQNAPGAAQYTGLVVQVANTCNNF